MSDRHADERASVLRPGQVAPTPGIALGMSALSALEAAGVALRGEGRAAAADWMETCHTLVANALAEVTR